MMFFVFKVAKVLHLVLVYRSSFVVVREYHRIAKNIYQEVFFSTYKAGKLQLITGIGRLSINV